MKRRGGGEDSGRKSARAPGPAPTGATIRLQLPANPSPRTTQNPPQGCGVESEDSVKLVHSADGTSLGEAFVHFTGPQARVRLGLSRDGGVMPSTGRPVEVLTAVAEDQQRRIMSGCQLK